MRQFLVARRTLRLLSATLLLGGTLSARVSAQDRLPSMPGYAQYQRMSPQIQGSVTLGVVNPVWSQDSRSFEYQWNGKWYRFDLGSLKAVESTPPPNADNQRSGFGRGGRGGRGGGPARGRQFESAYSPDSSHRAVYHDRNLFVADANGANEMP